MTHSDPQPSGGSGPAPRARGTQCLALVIAWAIVGVPAGWGVAQTVRKSIPLFTAPTARPASTQPGAPAR